MNKTAYYLVIACAALRAACSSNPPVLTPEQRSAKIEQQITEGGYAASRGYQIDTLEETWRHDGQSIGISLLTPKIPGVYPLIIYLPGLGESADGGQLWREMWAKAGYVVFSMQPSDISNALKELAPMLEKPDGDDSSADSDKARLSKALKNSELHYLGHTFFSQASLQKRAAHLLWAFAQIKQRAANGQDAFKMADLSRLILAGYDIGAQTTAAMIGEKAGINVQQAQDFRPSVAILLSPSVDMALGGLTSRDQNITMPLLVVTGAEDDDPYGISSPYVRTAIWEYAPAGNKYLLVLDKGGHQLLAGATASPRQNPGSAEALAEKPPSGGGQSRSGGGGRGRHGGGSQGGFMGGSAGKSTRGGHGHGAQEFKSIAAVASVTTAFMDSLCKSDKFAQSWLAGKASQWLEKTANLKVK